MKLQILALMALVPGESAIAGSATIRVEIRGTQTAGSWSSGLSGGFNSGVGDPVRFTCLAQADGAGPFTTRLEVGGVVYQDILFFGGFALGDTVAGNDGLIFVADMPPPPPSPPHHLPRVEIGVILPGGTLNGSNLNLSEGTWFQPEFLAGSGMRLAFDCVPGQPEVAFSIDAFVVGFAPDEYCGTNINSTGSRALLHWPFESSQSLSGAGAHLRLLFAPANTVCMVAYGTNPVALPFGDGQRCVGGQLCRQPFGVSSDAGIYNVDIPLGPGGGGFPVCDILIGSRWYFQGWFRDQAAGGSGFNTSNGLEVVFYD